MPGISAESMLLSFKSMFSNSTTSHASKRPSSNLQPRKMVSEALLEELEFQTREKEEYVREVQKKKNEILGRPDYTWLMDIPKSYRLPQIVRLEIEEISRLVDLNDVSSIISDFRTAITKDIPVDKIASYMKFTINHYLQNKKKQAKYKFDHYKQLRHINNEIPQRSSSTAIIKQTSVNINEEIYRPQSAPISHNWKKRSKIFPVDLSCLENTTKKDCLIIELDDHVNENNNEFTDQIISTSTV